MVQHMTGCTREEANRALLMNESVIDAIAALIPANPEISGNKYIPAKPKVDTGMDPEQIALCARGRWLQDRVNAVVSVAHSKILSAPPAQQSALPSAEASVILPLSAAEEVSESSPGNPVQTVQPIQQSEPLQ